MGLLLTMVAGALAVVFWQFMFPVMVKPFIDTDNYYKPTKLYVHNTFEGESPRIDFTREIVRDFDGQWHVNIWRVEDGNLHIVEGCRQRHGPPRRYKTRSSLEDHLDLDWFLEIPPGPECTLTPGTYMIEGEWDIVWPYMPTVEVQAGIDSNQFQVLERPE